MAFSARYRPEIDGLRAIAIIGVVLFHAGIKCPGGYVGVDVFFVISGYLITNLILRDIESGEFSLVSFWERRFRRILPALSLVVCITLLAGAILLLPNDYAKLGTSAIFQAVFAANIFFHGDTGYFATQADEKPLLHCWSLAVEEQFYLVVPLLLLLLFYLLRIRGHSITPMILGVLAILSFIWSQKLVMQDQPSAFFLLPSRAWELLTGVLVAFVPAQSLPQTIWKRELIAAIGLAAILVPMFAYDRETSFPGAWATPPVIGTALLIGSNLRSVGSLPPTLCGRCLSWKPLVGIGLISYSLYLWHWPLIAFSNYWSFSPLSKGSRCLIIMFSFVLAYASWKFIELPFRNRRYCSTQKSMFIFSGTSIAVVLALSLCVKHAEDSSVGTPVVFRLFGYTEVKAVSMSTEQVSINDILADRLLSLGKPSSNNECGVLLWGDSHAMASMPAFDKEFLNAGISGRAIVHSGVAPLLNFEASVPNGTEINTLEYNQAAFDWIRRHKVRHVILAGYWHVYETKGRYAKGSNHEMPVRFLDYYQNAIINTTKQLIAAGCQPWFLLQVPEHKFDVPKLFAYCRYFGGEEENYRTKIDNWNGLAGEKDEFINKLLDCGARIINPRPSFVGSTGMYYRASQDGLVLYGDKHHITVQGAEIILGPVIRQEFIKFRKNEVSR